MNTPRRPSRSELWPLTRDILAFLIGAFLLVWEAVFKEHPATIIVVAGVACLGVTGSGVAQRWLKTLMTEPEEQKGGRPRP